MKDSVRRSSRVPRRSAEGSQPETSSRRSRKSLAAETPVITRRRSRSNISRSRSPSKKSTHHEEIPRRSGFNTPPPKVISGKIMDSFCWVCHKMTDESMCNNCSRVYHTECLKKLRKNSSDSLTCECSYRSVEGRAEDYVCHPVILRKAFRKIVNDVLESKKRPAKNKQQAENSKFCNLFERWPQQPANSKLCEVVDLASVIDKVNDTPPFGGTGEFFLFVKWIHHNCYIVYGPDSDITHAALHMEKNIRLDLMDLEACPECYERMHCPETPIPDFFACVCKEPHQIVWAKLRGSPYWPAKVVRVHENGHADVRFFGTHDKSVLPSSQLLKFSLEYPAKKEISQPKFQHAMAEVSRYISNFKAVYGRFKYYEKNTPVLHQSKSPVKNNKKRKRSRSKTNQSEDASRNDDFCEIIAEIGIPKYLKGSPRKQMIKPSLNISILHDEQTDIKMNPGLPSSPLSPRILINSPAVMRNNPDSVGNFSEPASDVRCHMTWQVEHTDEENNPSELNSSDDFIGERATPQCSLPENGSIALYSSAPPTSAFVNIEGHENNSNDFVRTTTCNTLPVITSTVSSCAEENPNEIFPQASANSEEYTEISTKFSADCINENSLITERDKYVYRRLLDEINTEPLLAPDDDDILFIEETRGKRPLEDTVANNASKVNALCDLLFSNRPTIKERLYSSLLSTKQDFLLMWLEVNGHRIDSNDIKGFHVVYERCLRKIGGLNKTVDILHKENSQLALKVRDLESRLNLRNLLKGTGEEHLENLDTSPNSTPVLHQIVRNTVEQEKRKLEQEFEKQKKVFEEKIEALGKDLTTLKASLEAYERQEEAIKANLIDVECQTEILETFPDMDKETNLVSLNIKDTDLVSSNITETNIVSSNINSNISQFGFPSEQKNVAMKCLQTVTVYPPPPGSGLTGLFIGETSKIWAEEQTYVPAIPVVISNSVPSVSNSSLPAIQLSTGSSSSKSKLNQTSKSKVSESRISAKNSKKRQK